MERRALLVAIADDDELTTACLARVNNAVTESRRRGALMDDVRPRTRGALDVVRSRRRGELSTTFENAEEESSGPELSLVELLDERADTMCYNNFKRRGSHHHQQQ